MRLTLPLLAISSPLVFLTACAKKEPETVEIQYPKMVLSESTLEFGNASAGDVIERSFLITNNGEMPMGIGSVEVGPGMEGNFTVSISPDAVECPEGTDTGIPADGKEINGDTGGGITDTGDDGGNQGGSGDDEALLVLPPGCHVPAKVSFSPVTIGQIYGSVIVTSIQKTLTQKQQDANELPEYLRDPIHWKQLIYLHGETEVHQGAVIVRPRSYDFGYVNPLDIRDNVGRLSVSNVGDGDINLSGVELEDDCSAAFDITYAFDAGHTLHPEESALVEVTFTPTDSNASFCTLHVLSEDPNNPDIDVSLQGNAGVDVLNEPPQVYVRYPEPGYRFNGVGNLHMELNVYDVNQPATTLICKVKSAVIEKFSVASCTPSDESGHVFVDIPADDLDAGVDTLLVTVTDASETTAYASTSVVIATDYPEGDDDGDGFDEMTSPPDCDDSDRNTYPKAAEIYDGKDNNCNFIVDEDTIGYDDDGDSFTEMDGDCNDFNDQAYPTAPERPDGVDNDCDDLVDESTSIYDDDGDGYAEVNSDCDDHDPLVYPGQKEVCDGVDNDCDGLKDSADGCVSTNTKPVVVGIVKTSQNACLSGEKVAMDVFIYDADNQTISYQWSDDSGVGAANFDNASIQQVAWSCPELPNGSEGRKYNVYVIGFDPDNNQVWTFDELSVYPADYDDLYKPYIKVLPVE